MSQTTIGIIGVAVLIVLLFSRMRIGLVMALVGFLGFAYLVTPEAALSTLGRIPFANASSYSLTVIPLFVLMGEFAFHSGISQRLYNAAYKSFGQLRGGLAMATVAACAGFAAICGSSPATAATMGAVSLPEMRRYKYSSSLATGCIAAAGSLGILIPPSVILVIYGILTEQSIGKLFAAGILPGILLAALFMIVISVSTSLNPALGPSAPPTSLKEKLSSITGGAGETILIFAIVIGGLFMGFFTPTEAAAIGALGTLVVGLARRQLTRQPFVAALKEAARITAMIFLIMIGAFIFGRFLAVTRLPFELGSWVGGLPLPRVAIMLLIILMYLMLGCVMDVPAMVILTIPIVFPVAMSLAYDPIWFGVIIVLVAEMGAITPPVGVNVYVIKGVAKDVPLEVIFKGILPFLGAIIACVAILVAFPQIALFLPGLMG